MRGCCNDWELKCGRFITSEGHYECGMGVKGCGNRGVPVHKNCPSPLTRIVNFHYLGKFTEAKLFALDHLE